MVNYMEENYKSELNQREIYIIEKYEFFKDSPSGCSSCGSGGCGGCSGCG